MKRIQYVILICAIIAGTHFFNSRNAYSNDIIDLILNRTNDKETGKDGPAAPIDFYFLPPLENKNIFESINDLSICRNEDVRKYIYLYLTDGREFLNGAIARSNRYLKTVEDIFDKHSDMPAELSLLPMLESAFNPYAVSRSKAVGIWQFLKGTSGFLGLKINRWVDERRDIEKSTLAAIRHLRSLYGIFGSWELALAAYNGGGSYVRKAMIKSKSETIADLIESGVLNRETGEYVYRFSALAIIYKNQDLFNIDNIIPEDPDQETEIITLEYPVKIKNIAALTGVPVQTLRVLNPELRQNITPPYETKYTFILPKGCKEKLVNNISELYDIKYSKVRKHIVKQGECVSRIAASYKAEIKKIVLLNNLKSPHSIKPGLELYIPN